MKTNRFLNTLAAAALVGGLLVAAPAAEAQPGRRAENNRPAMTRRDTATPDRAPQANAPQNRMRLRDGSGPRHDANVAPAPRGQRAPGRAAVDAPRGGFGPGRGGQGFAARPDNAPDQAPAPAQRGGGQGFGRGQGFGNGAGFGFGQGFGGGQGFGRGQGFGGGQGLARGPRDGSGPGRAAVDAPRDGFGPGRGAGLGARDGSGPGRGAGLGARDGSGRGRGPAAAAPAPVAPPARTDLNDAPGADEVAPPATTAPRGRFGRGPADAPRAGNPPRRGPRA